MKRNSFTLLLATIIMFTSSSCVIFVPSKRRHHKVVIVGSTQTLQHTPTVHQSFITEQLPYNISNYER